MSLYEYSSKTQVAIRRLELLSKQYDSVREGMRKDAYSPVRHKVFVSYHAADAVEVLDFIESHTGAFIPRAIGMEEDGSDIIDSTNGDYIKDTIRRKHLKDTTVTLVAIGECTWARKFVDWEIYTSLRNPNRNGLLAIQMPSVSGTKPGLPERLRNNLGTSEQEGYADYWVYPSSESTLRTWIDRAFEGRTARAHLVDLGGSPRQRNYTC